MKILIIPSSSSDYLQDSVYLGMKELFGKNVECIYDCSYLYKETLIVKHNLWGYGFTYTNILDPSLNNISIETLTKIKNNYYDLIIYSFISRNSTMLDEVMKVTNGKNVFLINGEDENWRFDNYHNNQSIYFKRELYDKKEKNIEPIYYAIHHSKFVNTPQNKIQEMSKSTPSLDYCTNISSSKILFDNEFDYYHDYQISKFGLTMKKGGWDSMRHYEIIANGCVPIFIDIDNCPDLCLINLPKKLLSEISKNHLNITNSEYDIYLNELLEYGKENLTTIKLAKYLLNFYV
jgi:hypothetical protein